MLRSANVWMESNISYVFIVLFKVTLRLPLDGDDRQEVGSQEFFFLLRQAYQ